MFFFGVGDFFEEFWGVVVIGSVFEIHVSPNNNAPSLEFAALCTIVYVYRFARMDY